MKLDPSVFVGKLIFVGVDVHKATYSLAAVFEGEVIHRVGSMPADPRRLIEHLAKRFPGAKIRSAYEAGFSGFVLHRALSAAGFESIVVNAASIAVAANDRVKTDKRDAAKIALHLSRGMLRGIRVPTIEEELRRQITRTRQQLVKERSRIGNKIKSKLMQFGILALDDKRVMSAKLLAEFRQLKLPSDLAIAVGALADVWDSVAAQVKNLEAEIDVQAKAQLKLEAIYRSVPGIGRITGRALANELGDMSQFPNERQLYSFVGLTPSEYSSGPYERKGHITRQGAAILRGLLVEAAWTAVAKDPTMKQVYERIKATRGGKRAIVAVARRLVGRLRACLCQGVPYEIDHGTRAA